MKYARNFHFFYYVAIRYKLSGATTDTGVFEPLFANPLSFQLLTNLECAFVHVDALNASKGVRLDERTPRVITLKNEKLN